MLYFKSESGEVFAYESEEDRDEFGPDDLVSMSDKEIDAHLNPAPITPSLRDIEEFRLKAYAEPLTGSDRLFSESTRMQIMGEVGFEEVRDRAISRFEEIQAQHPWPAK